MATAAVPDLFTIPLQALRPSTRETISNRLNPPKIIPTDNGLPRDWRGLAELALIPGEDIPLIGSKSDQTSQILDFWKTATLGDITVALERMDRFDVIDDTTHMMEQDALKYVEMQKRAATSAPEINLEVDKQIITYDDKSRIENGLEPQYYDAFLLFSDEDIEFATLIIKNLEGKYNLKLCVKDRDLVGGLRFEHGAIMKLISERCNRLIVVVSPSFLQSEDNKFFVTFAQALGIDQNRRKIVPVLYQHCELPPDLKYYFLLDYSRAGQHWDFWKKLKDSIETPGSQYDNGICTKAVEDSFKELVKKGDTSRLEYSIPSRDPVVKDKELPQSPSHSKSFSDFSENVDTKKKSKNLKPFLTRCIDALSKKKPKKQKSKKQLAEAS